MLVVSEKVRTFAADYMWTIGSRVPIFSGILEALCSFLQAENLRTFQIA